MTSVIDSPDSFIVIGENIHATRSVRRGGRRMTTLEDGSEAVTYRNESGDQAYLRVPDGFKSTQPYEQGQIKHMMIAVNKGLSDDEDAQAEGAAYVRAEAKRQIAAGSHFLDLNVDEVSYKLEIQKRAMAWLVGVVQEVSTAPLSIDSSNSDIIAAGLEAYDGRAGRPLVNSVALERLDTLDLVKEHDGRCIVTASGVGGMPEDASERVSNVSSLIAEAQARSIPLDDIYVDALVFPISVSGEYGPHYLDAVRDLRNAFGGEVHIGGGLSNVSFGLPKRKLINDTFIYLAIEAGIDSAIMDPVQSKIGRIFSLELDSEPVRLARDMLLGKDEYCMGYLRGYKAGKLD